MQKEKNEENSQEQAEILKLILLPILMLDVDYCREMAIDLRKQASTQETLAILNPAHPQAKNDLLRLQAKALDKICDYIDTLKEIDKTKLKIVVEEKQRNEINMLFL